MLTSNIFLTKSADLIKKLGHLLLNQIGTHRAFKSYMQRECHKAHNLNVPRLLDPSSSHGSKNFWSHIKAKRNEQSGVPSIEKGNETFSQS